MTIALAYTDTPAGAAAQEYALEQAQRLTTNLVVMSIDGSVVEPDRFSSVDATIREPVARSRDAVGDFVDMTEALKPELVVVGIRHRSPVGKMLLGSAAQQIILEVNAPVVAVKPAN